MKLLTRIVTGVVLVLAAHSTAHAADSTWSLTSGFGTWVTSGNWNNGVPGATGTTTNSTDIATFSTLTAAGTVGLDNNRNVGGISFSNTGTAGYVLQPNANVILRLTNGGTIQTTSAQGANNDNQVRVRVSIQGDGGIATFAANGSGTLSFTGNSGGSVVGNSAAGSTTTLYLDGTSFGRIDTGAITNGTNGGVLALVKNGSGIWQFGVASSFTGGFTLNAGRIRLQGVSNALGTGLVTLNGGSVSSNDSNARSLTNSILVGGNFGISNATNPGSVTLSGSMDLGGATRTVTVVASGGTFSGLISNGGLTKSGTGNLTLSNTNTYSGDTLVQSGTLFVGSDLALQNSGFDTSGAGRLSLAGRTAATFGGLLGSVNLATSATYAGVSALTLNPQTGTSYDYGGVIANGTSAGMSLTKTGLGSQRLTGVSTYTGTTFVNAGRLEIAGSGNLANTAGVVINGSGAELKWNSSTALSQPITFTQGTISGTGAIGVAVAVATNDILSPGNSPGSQAYTAGLTWSPGGTYQWEINNATGAADVNWDILNVSGGALDLSGLSSGSTFALDLTTLTGTVPGPMVNYVDGQSYTFSLASYASLALPGGFSGNDLTSLFSLSFANWRNTAPSLANVSVVNNTVANTIDLVIVPEPTGLAVAGIAFAAAGWLLRRRRTAA